MKQYNYGSRKQFSIEIKINLHFGWLLTWFYGDFRLVFGYCITYLYLSCNNLFLCISTFYSRPRCVTYKDIWCFFIFLPFSVGDWLNWCFQWFQWNVSLSQCLSLRTVESFNYCLCYLIKERYNLSIGGVRFQSMGGLKNILKYQNVQVGEIASAEVGKLRLP